MIRASWLLVGALALGVVGCGPAEQAEGGLRRTANERYTKIVSLSPSSTELVVQYAPNVANVLGRTVADNYPKYNLANIPIVASVKPDYEKLAKIGPDLVIYDKALYSEQDAAKIKQLGAKVFVIDANTVADFEKQLYELGRLEGSETNVAGYVDHIQIAVNAARSNVPVGKRRPKVAVMMAGNGSEHYICGTNSFIADVVKIAGGDPIGPKSDMFVPLSPEWLAANNPDVIVTAGEPGAILTDPRLQTTNALKKPDRAGVIGINQDVITRRGARVDKLIDTLSMKLAQSK